MKIQLTIKVLTLLIFAGSSLQAQDPIQYNLIPLSPNVTSLGEYVDAPVSMYTGLADISVPITELKVGSISLPISLSYHSGGITVEEIASWVGLGWSLNAGGVVSRVVNGLPDETGLGYGFVNPPHQMSYQHFIRYWEYARGDHDSQHDMFYYNFSGHSGKFVLDFEDGYKPVLLPQKNLHIDFPNFSISNTDEIIIISPEGNKYTFDQAEQISSLSSCTDGGYQYTPTYKNAWYLSKIESPTGNHFINFSYTTESLSYRQKGSESKYISLGGGSKQDRECFNDLTTSVKRLAQITTSNGQSIEFVPGSERCDLSDDYMLGEIILKQNSTPIKKFIFNYKYMEGDDLEPISSYNPAQEENNPDLRLMLTSIEQAGYNQGSSSFGSPISYKSFSYFTNLGLPSRFSFQQDLFGYFNGKYQNNTLVPGIFLLYKYREGAITTTSLEHAKQGMLYQIQHSTGGTTTYEYDLNECANLSVTHFLPPTSSNLENYEVNKNSATEIPFEITESGGRDVELEMMFTEGDYCSGGNCKIEVYLMEEQSPGFYYPVFNSLLYQNQTNVDLSLHLDEGNYKVVKVINDATYASQIDAFHLKVFWELPENPNTVVENKAGGLRVRTVEVHDPTSDETIVTKYNYNGGYLNHYSGFTETLDLPAGNYCQFQTLFSVFARHSHSSVPMIKTQGGHVGYNQVTKLQGENGENGYIVYNYFTGFEHPDYLIVPSIWHGEGTMQLGTVAPYDGLFWESPYPLLDSKDWKRGLPQSMKVYDESGTKVSSKHYTYKFYDDPSKPYYDANQVKEVTGVKTQGNPVVDYCPESPTTGYIKIAFYKLRSSRYELIEEIDSTFYAENKIGQTVTYEYEEDPKHFLPTEIAQTNSDGKETITTFIRPSDPGSGAPSQMYIESNPNYKHMVSPLIVKSIDVNSQETSKIYTEYTYNTGNDMVLPDYKDIYPTGGVNYFRVEFTHNNDGNPVEQYRVDDKKTAYLWDASGTFLMATVENATYTQISSQDGKVSTYNSETLFNSLNSLVPGSIINTYSYKPFYGMISHTDPNGRTTTYDYDDFGRLAEIRDDDNNDVIKEYTYHYKN